ncbi:hypothetical protein RUM43_002891 [Polyplax serrata]|uniref:Uncharacterized protein n=1 Tax=Polyplax serrata TaxID=468196 RepID=A0AAN8NZD6_POLSC
MDEFFYFLPGRNVKNRKKEREERERETGERDKGIKQVLIGLRVLEVCHRERAQTVADSRAKKLENGGRKAKLLFPRQKKKDEGVEKVEKVAVKEEVVEIHVQEGEEEEEEENHLGSIFLVESP